MKHSIKSLLSFLAATLFAVTAFGQVTTSSLNGQVTDEKGEPLPGAVVVAVHTPTGSQYYAVANAQGQYAIKGMRSGGPYEVNISFIGNQTLIVKDITLQLGEGYNLNAELKDASQQLKEVVVVASATKFATEKTGPSTNISANEMTALPTVSRSIEDIAKLSPYANGMSFAGGDGRSSNFTVDGANFNNNFGLSDGLPGGGNPISMDAIQEVQVVVAPYDVRQTNFIGGGINAVTKSGTNTFKATAYTLQYNADIHGQKALGATATSIPAEYANHLYGVTIGGPIIKDKLFFFVSGEYGQSPNTFQSWRASDATGTADEYGNHPGTGDNTAKISRTSKEDLKLVSDLLKERYGYDTGSYENFPATNTDTRILARIDWNINEKHKLSARYNYTSHINWQATNGSSGNMKSRASANRFSQYGMSYLNSCYYYDDLAQTVTLDLNSRLSDKMHNQFLATYSYLADVRGTGSDMFPFIDILDGQATTTGKIYPYISAGYELFSYNNAVKNGILTIKDDFSYDLGSHHFLAGVSYEHQYALNAYMRNGSGYYRYLSLEDFINEAAPETVCLTYGYNGNETPAVQVTFNQVGLYAQDEWDVNKNFKLTYGARFDLLAFDPKDIMTNNAVKAVDYNGTSVDTGVWPKTRVMISPRVGYVWDVLGDKSLKVRGGIGMFTGRLPLVYFTNMPSNSNMIQNVTSITTVWSGKTGKADPLLASFAGPIITDKGKLLEKLNSLNATKYPLVINPDDGVLGSEIDAVDPEFKMPMVAKVSLGLDYEVPVNFPFTISAEGMYTKTIHGLMMKNINIKSDDSDNWERMAGADNRLIYPSSGYRYTGTDAYILGNTNKGYGYTANVTIKATPVKNLNLMAAYTKTESKELTGMPGSAAASVFTGLYSVNGAQFATLQRSQYVVPDRIIASATYRHNFFGKEGFDSRFSLMYEGYSSGGYSFLYDADINGDGSPYDMIYIPATPDEIQFASADDQIAFWNFVKQDKYLNSHRGQYAEAYAARAPWLHQIDFRFTQDFGVKVGKNLNRIQLSADLLNVGNLLNSNWGLPSILSCNSGMILHCTNADEISSTVAPIYTFAANSDHTYTKSTSFYSCWQLQLGLRYFFN